MKLIPKDAVLAEIEKVISGLRRKCNPNPLGNMQECMAASEIEALNLIKDSLDILEVKEVDLEKYYHDFLQKEWFDKICIRTMSEMMAFTAKHFFELGVKVAQKGEGVC